MNINRLITKENALAWDSAPDREYFVVGLIHSINCVASGAARSRVNADLEDLRDQITDPDDGQPTEYEEWQDYMGGDDWDHGQYGEFE